jgi:beta-phosphoglucomutase
MRWIERFQLFLFDFDGLLVDTEPLHWAAFKETLAQRGFAVSWDFRHYCRLAHRSTSGLRDASYAAFPALFEQQPDWEAIRREKTHIYLDKINKGELQLMPGVEPLLKILEERGIKRCVVTNASMEQVEVIRKGISLLKSIPLWITRECYGSPKPDAEPYLTAIQRLAEADDRMIGFEDTLKGLQSLRGTSATAVLISPHEVEPPGAYRFSSFEEIPENWKLG